MWRKRGGVGKGKSERGRTGDRVGGGEGEGRKDSIENILNGSRVDVSMLVGREVLSAHIETCPLSNEETE